MLSYGAVKIKLSNGIRIQRYRIMFLDEETTQIWLPSIKLDFDFNSFILISYVRFHIFVNGPQVSPMICQEGQSSFSQYLFKI